MPPDQYADLAGERDEEPLDDVTPEMSSEDAQGVIYSGICNGGPWDGTVAESRYPKGFLLIHMPSRKVWIYERLTDGTFVVRSAVPGELMDEGPVNRWRAADEANYDIRSLGADVVAPADEAGAPA